ncbi:hypothetical protein AM493_18570 [Flavobacterium akiainvivens]|uniref:DUF4595 domain-containing protein n=2 Tax=Flavobacterium akiainvivens TaxID=1202724 RepID=A0A0M8MDD2_9FLAO|nr:hypothetical protein AM493_18570 [Flavobacterium akiainvivens]
MVAALAFTSCADDDLPYNPGEETGEVLLRQMVVTPASGQSITSQYTYDGDRITAVSHSNSTNESYSYATNGALTEVRYYEEGNLVRKSTFEYAASGAFNAVVHMYYDIANPANNHAERFTYAIAGQDITVVKYTGDEQSQTVEDQTFVLKVINNNITAITGDIEASYSFDFQASPLSNVADFGVMYLADLQGGINNVITATEEGVQTTANYQYTSDGYPAQATVTTAGQTYTVTYTY